MHAKRREATISFASTMEFGVGWPRQQDRHAPGVHEALLATRDDHHRVARVLRPSSCIVERSWSL